MCLIFYVLWYGHTVCKNCTVLGFQWDMMKFPTMHIQLPLFISCSWCNHLSFRFKKKKKKERKIEDIKFLIKNFSLHWMVESMDSERTTLCSCHEDHWPAWLSNSQLWKGSICSSRNKFKIQIRITNWATTWIWRGSTIHWGSHQRLPARTWWPHIPLVSSFSF